MFVLNVKPTKYFAITFLPMMQLKSLVNASGLLIYNCDGVHQISPSKRFDPKLFCWFLFSRSVFRAEETKRLFETRWKLEGFVKNSVTSSLSSSSSSLLSLLLSTTTPKQQQQHHATNEFCLGWPQDKKQLIRLSSEYLSYS